MGYYNQQKGDLPQLGAIPRVFRGRGRRVGQSSSHEVRGQAVRQYAQRLANASHGTMTTDDVLRRLHARFRAPGQEFMPPAFAPPQLPMVPFNPRTLTANIETMPGAATISDYAMSDYALSGYGQSTRDIAARYGLGNATVIYGMGDELGGFSFKRFARGVARGVKRVARPVQHALTQVGHETGKIVTSKIGQAAIGTVLAATGVGIPAAAAIMGGTKAFGNLIKPGGNIKHAAIGLYQGAAEGAAAGVVGKALRTGAAKSAERAVVKGVKGVGKGVFHGAESVVKGVVHGAESLGKAIIGIPGSFIPTNRDPNGDGINEDTGLPSDEASAAEQAGRAMRGARLPVDQKPRVGWPGQFPRSADDPTGTGIDQTTGDLTQEAAGAVQNGSATLPSQLPPDAPPPPPYTAPYGGGGGGGGGDMGGLAAGAGLAAGGDVLPAEAAAAGAGAGGLGGLLGNINPTMVLAGAAAVIFLPKIIGGGKRRGAARGRAPRRRSRSRRR